MLEQLRLAVEIAGVPLGAAGGGVAPFDGPAPFEEQHVDVRDAGVEGVRAAEVVSGFEAIAVGLEKHDVVAAPEERVDQRPAVAAASVGVSVTPFPRKPQKLYPIFIW